MVTGSCVQEAVLPRDPWPRQPDRRPCCVSTFDHGAARGARRAPSLKGDSLHRADPGDGIDAAGQHSEGVERPLSIRGCRRLITLPASSVPVRVTVTVGHHRSLPQILHAVAVQIIVDPTADDHLGRVSKKFLTRSHPCHWSSVKVNAGCHCTPIYIARAGSSRSCRSQPGCRSPAGVVGEGVDCRWHPWSPSHG